MIDRVSLAKEHARLVQGLNGNQRRRYMMLLANLYHQVVVDFNLFMSMEEQERDICGPN